MHIEQMIDNTNEATVISVCLNINTEITFSKYTRFHIYIFFTKQDGKRV